MQPQIVTIEVDQAVATILRTLKAKAETQGVPLSHLLQSLVGDNQSEMEKSPTGKTPEEKAKAFLQWAESHIITASPLSEEAISRKSIYADRDDNQL